MKDKSQQKQTMMMLIASLKTKIVQTQKQIASVKSSNQQLEQDVEQIQRVRQQRRDRWTLLRQYQQDGELNNLENQQKKLNEVKSAIYDEISHEDQNIDELEMIINQLKRNIKECTKEKEKAAFTKAQSKKVLKNMGNLREMVKEDQQKLVYDVKKTGSEKLTQTH